MRIIAATNRTSRGDRRRARFREDLYYRINVIPIHLPPLRQRREDIPLLVEHFLQKFCQRAWTRRRSASRSRRCACCESYDWPGNVRELENLIERMLALSHAETITTGPPRPPADQPADATPTSISSRRTGSTSRPTSTRSAPTSCSQALERTGGVQTQAAELLGMSFRSFRYYAKKAGIKGGD